jgi:hypothetical protein
MKQSIKNLKIAIYAIVAYLIVTGIGTAIAPVGMSEQLRQLI